MNKYKYKQKKYKSLSFIISSVYHHDINHPVPAPYFCRFASSVNGFPLFEAVSEADRPADLMLRIVAGNDHSSVIAVADVAKLQSHGDLCGSGWWVWSLVHPEPLNVGDARVCWSVFLLGL